MELLTKGKISDDIKEIVFDKTISSRYKNLKHYFVHKKIKYNAKELIQLIQLVEKELVDQVTYLSYLLFYAMSKSGEWGYSGEQAIRNSFTRIVLNIPLSEAVTYDHTLKFNKAVEKSITTYDLNLMTPTAAFDLYKNYTLTVMGELWKHDDVQLTHYLKFCGSDLGISYGQFQMYMQYTLGEVGLLKKGPFEIITFKREVMRTPNVIMARAAANQDTKIIVRMESLKTIFYQKWCQVFKKDYYLQSRIESDPMWGISQFIKERALTLYGVTDSEGMDGVAKDFIKDTRETITFHELGHGVMFNGVIDADSIGLTQSTKIIGTETIFNTIWEFMADFAPEQNGIHGPMYHMTQISKKNISRAERMFWTYFSDIWFYDTDDQYMINYSDVMVLVLLKYIKKDLSIDFQQLEFDLSYDPTFKPDREKMGAFQRISEFLIWDGEGIKEIIKKATYTLIKPMDYTHLSRIVEGQMKDKYPQHDRSSSAYALLYWQWFIKLLKLYSHESYNELLAYIETKEKKTMMKLMVISAGKKRAEAYGFDHRKYIIDRCRALGMVPAKTS